MTALLRRLRAASLLAVVALGIVLPPLAHECASMAGMDGASVAIGTAGSGTATAGDANATHAAHGAHAADAEANAAPAPHAPDHHPDAPAPCDCVGTACCVFLTPWTPEHRIQLQVALAEAPAPRLGTAVTVAPSSSDRLLPFAIGPPAGALL